MSCRADRTAQELGYRNLTELIADKRYDGLAFREIAEWSGIPERTIWNHCTADLKGGDSVKTDKRKNHIDRLIRLGLDALRRKRFTEPRRDGKPTLEERTRAEMEKTKRRLFG